MSTIARIHRWALVALLGSWPALLQAQEATLKGTVRDASDTVVPGATVTARNLDSGGSSSTVSDASGVYRVGLAPGRYRVTAELSGFTPAAREPMVLAAGGELVVDLTLAVSDLAESVSVTGSNMRVTGFQAIVPVQVTSREQIETSGFANFSDVFREIPSNSGSEATSESLPRYGQSQFNLRGLGYSSTLTLVNGRRAAIAPVSDETGAEYTDVNQFPLAMVERVDVLKDGASAIYGSDAVAGVVNIITRRGFTGLDLSGGVQSASNRVGFANVAAGHRYGRGVVNVYGTYFAQTGNDRTAFPWLVERVGGNGVPGRSQLLNTNGSPSTYRLGGLNASGQPIVIGPATAGFADPDCEAAGGVFRIDDTGAIIRSSCLHDFADQVAVLPDTRRLQVLAELTHRLATRATLSAEVGFSRNTSETTRGPGSFGNGTVTNGSGSVYIPASHPFNFFQRSPADPLRLVYVPPANWDPAVHQAVDVVASLRPLGVAYNGRGNAGLRRSQTDYPRVGTTLDLDLGHAWTGSASYQFAIGDFTDYQELRYDAAVLNGLIASGEFNPFGIAITNPALRSPKDGRSVAGNSQEVIDRFIVDSLDTARTERHIFDMTASGRGFSIGGRSSTLAVGAQYRRLTLDSVPDPLQGSGRGDTSNVQPTQAGKQDVVGAYGELAAPLSSAVTTHFALRFEDYGRFGTTLNPKIAGTAALGPHVRLRSSWGTSFQAPTMFQTSSSTARAFLTDPVALVNGVLGCQPTSNTASGNVLVETVGDENLEPQRSLNLTLGGILSPLRGMQVSVDYWRYRYKDLIAAGTAPQSIVDNDCRDGIPNDPRIVRGADGTLSRVTNSFLNVGRVTTDGIDIAFEHRWQAGALGSLAGRLDATWLRQFDVVGGEGGAFDGAGNRNAANNFRTMPQWRGVAGLEWSRAVQRAGVTLRYIGSYTNDAGNNAVIDAYRPLDFSYGYTFATGGRSAFTVMVGLDNAFDADPPALVRNDPNGTPLPTTNLQWNDRPGYDAYSGADLRGRVFWARFMHRF